MSELMICFHGGDAPSYYVGRWSSSPLYTSQTPDYPEWSAAPSTPPKRLSKEEADVDLDWMKIVYPDGFMDRVEVYPYDPNV